MMRSCEGPTSNARNVQNRTKPSIRWSFSDNAERLTIGRLDSTLTGLGRQSDLTLIGRRYFVEEYLATPRLSVNIETALNGTTPVHLQDGDRLVVPADLGVIRVYGQVRQPGLSPL